MSPDISTCGMTSPYWVLLKVTQTVAATGNRPPAVFSMPATRMVDGGAVAKTALKAAWTIRSADSPTAAGEAERAVSTARRRPPLVLRSPSVLPMPARWWSPARLTGCVVGVEQHADLHVLLLGLVDRSAVSFIHRQQVGLDVERLLCRTMAVL